MAQIPIIYADILSDYHILIGGTTGSGKSWLIKGLIRTILKYYKDDYLLVLCDPKKVELRQFRKDALLYADTLKEIKSTLVKVENIMDNRYRKMQRHAQTKFDGQYILVVIDEFADLMDNKKEFFPIIARLLRLGRASRVIILLATQNPARTSGLPASASSNINCRIALHCQSSTESKQIAGVKGAELLPYFGQAIVSLPNKPLERVKVPDEYGNY